MPENPNNNRTDRFQNVLVENNGINQVSGDRVRPSFEYLASVAPLTPHVIAVRYERIRGAEPRIPIHKHLRIVIITLMTIY